ncbi:MAG: hypothetical protein WBA93_22870 [Microcoleaceae cyanobacterium]
MSTKINVLNLHGICCNYLIEHNIIHCKTELGHTGMVRDCLVALNYYPTKAITTVRENPQYTIGVPNRL